MLNPEKVRKMLAAATKIAGHPKAPPTLRAQANLLIRACKLSLKRRAALMRFMH